MSGPQGWRTETDALDYFTNQRKQLETADRRPVIRKASDLVGPGLNRYANRITNFNDALATFDGYFSADGSAASAPPVANPSAAKFVGHVVSDGEYGGTQIFTNLGDGTDAVEWRRVFIRPPADPSSFVWGQWRPVFRVVPSAYGTAASESVPTATTTALPVPTAFSVDTAQGSVFGIIAPNTITLNMQGVYIGQAIVDTPSTSLFKINVTMNAPNGTVNSNFTWGRDETSTEAVVMPFTIIHAFNSTGTISFTTAHSSGSTRNIALSRFHITRIGDAI